MRTLTIDKWRNDPSISVIVAATFPTYRKHRVNIDLSGRWLEQARHEVPA